MFKKLYTRYVDFSVAKPWWILAGTLVVTLFFVWQATNLALALTWLDMMPQKDPVVIEYQRLIKLFGTTDMIIAAVEAPSEEQVKALARETAERFARHDQWVKRVDYTVDTAFIRQHGLMLVKTKDLRRMKKTLANPNLLAWLTALNEDFEREYIEDSGNLRKQENQAATQLHALGVFVDTMGRLSPEEAVTRDHIDAMVDSLTIGEEYYLSTDRKMALLMIQPTFTINEIDKATLGCLDLQAEADKIEEAYPGTSVRLTGMNVIMKDETMTMKEDSMLITLGALILITLMFIVTFRMWTAPLLAMMILMVGIIWDYGLTGMLIGKLSLFSSMSALILIGLGVDYLMHFLNMFFEARAEGQDARDSVLAVYQRSGKGIVMGALTTAVAFLSMILSDYPAMAEFGVTMGLGIISCMAVTMLVLPAIMILRERHQARQIAQGKVIKPFSAEFKFLQVLTRPAYQRPWLTTIVVIVVSGLMFWGATRLRFDQNLLNIEAKGLESVELYDVMEERFNLSADGLVFAADSLAEAERVTHQLDEMPNVGGVESLALYLPSEKSQQERRPLVKEIRDQVRGRQYAGSPDPEKMKTQLQRLSDNIVEMGQLGYLGGMSRLTDHCDLLTGLDEEGNQARPNRILQAAATVAAASSARLGDFSQRFFQRLKANTLSMANPAEVKLAEVRSDIRERFISPDGKLYAVQVFARKNVYKHFDDTSFIEDVHAIAPGATGMPAFFKRLITISAEKGRLALGIAAVIIFIMLFLIFRKLSYVIIALLPTILAYLFAFGTMGWINMPLSIVSVMVIPLIMGIGIDDGIHLLHRYQVEGPGSQPIVIASTGKAISLTTATTVLGFGSLIFAKYQGMGHMGWLTVFGIGWAFVISVFLIPALLKIMEGRKQS